MKMNHLEGAQFIGWRVKHHGQDPDSSLVVSHPPRKRRLGTSQKGRINTGHPPQRQGLHKHLKANGYFVALNDCYAGSLHRLLMETAYLPRAPNFVDLLFLGQRKYLQSLRETPSSCLLVSSRGFSLWSFCLRVVLVTASSLTSL